MRILVTGGAGFIGSHLCEALLKLGHTVVCADNESTGRHANIAHLVASNNFSFVAHDVTEPLAVAVEQIYNLACAASPVHYQSQPIKTMQTCVLGALNVLELARKNGARVLQASTSEVYGDPEVHPQTESYWGHVNCTGPRACYDEGKRAAETLFFDHARTYQTNIRVARIFNTYGPRMLPNDGRVVSNFIVQALQGQPLTVYGNGLQTRSFCYVTDLVAGLLALMNAPESPGPVNLGNPQECTVLDLAHQILTLAKSASPLVARPIPVDDPQRRRPDIGRAVQWLGWQPKISVGEGLAKTVAYFRSIL